MTNIILSSLFFALSTSAGGSLIGIDTSNETDDSAKKESTESESVNEENYIRYEQFTAELEVSNKPLKIKIYSDTDELIAKWQGNGHLVKNKAKKYLTKASLGRYFVSVFKSDGSLQKLIIVK